MVVAHMHVCAHTAVFYRTFTITYTCQWTPPSINIIHFSHPFILQSVRRYLNGSFTVKWFVPMEMYVTYWCAVRHDTVYQHTQDNSLNIASSKALGFHKRIVHIYVKYAVSTVLQKLWIVINRHCSNKFTCI